MSRSHAPDARHAVDAAHARGQRGEQRTQHAPDAAKSLPGTVSNHAVAQALGSGAPLTPEVRSEMEARFGVDLADVRIHDQPSDQQLAQSLSAKAFAVGDHIAFNRGHYAPGTRDGKHLLAHELAHVIQQRRGASTAPQPQGGPLEAAAEHAASDVVGGSGPVTVSGASGVGVARQPLPDEPASDLPRPRSLGGSLVKSEDALSDEALHREIDLIQQWLDRYPAEPGSDHLILEWNLLIAEDLSRTGRRVAQAAQQPKPPEGSVAAMAGMVHQGRLEGEEAAAAHRSYRGTGLVPKTVSPLAPVEVKVGRPMSRSERYDAMLKLQGQAEPVTVSDLSFDEVFPGEGRRDPEFLTHDEFKKEFYDRYKQKESDCSSGITRPDVRDRCLHNLQGEWGGAAFRAAREESYQRAYALWLHAQEQIESMQSGGPISLAGRVGGYALGAATGHDALRWSEYGADLGGMGDLGFSMYGAASERARLQSYSEGGGLQVGRDADITLFEPRSPGPAATPSNVTAPELTRSSSTLGGPAGALGGSQAVPPLAPPETTAAGPAATLADVLSPGSPVSTPETPIQPAPDVPATAAPVAKPATTAKTKSNKTPTAAKSAKTAKSAKPPQAPQPAKPKRRRQPKAAKQPVPSIDEQIKEAEKELAASRKKTSEYFDERESAGRSRKGGPKKGIDNAKERLWMLKRQQAYPDRQMLKNCEVKGVQGADGKLTPTSSIADVGREPDFIEIDPKGGTATFGELKSEWELNRSLSGGPGAGGGPTTVNPSSKMGGQFSAEDAVLEQARKSNGKVLITGYDIRTGKQVTLALEPDKVRRGMFSSTQGWGVGNVWSQ